MTTRGQNLRSSTPGNSPAAGTRAPGELWLNFADRQIGYIDAGKAAQPVVAIRYFSTLANYAAGDFVVQAGGVWVAKGAVPAGAFTPSQWNELAYLTDIPAVYVLPTASTTVLGGVKVDGTTININSGVISSAGLVAVATTPPASPQAGAMWYDLVGGQLYVYADDGTSKQWVIAVNQNIGGGVFLPMTGGTLTGPLTLAGDPTTPLMAATKQYVDGGGGYSHDNRIINGDMRIDQRNNGASGTATGAYTVDRWKYGANVANKGTWGRSTLGPVGLSTTGCGYGLLFTSSSAYAALATDFFAFNQPIEADTISDFVWGTASAQPVTLSFWALSSIVGTFSGSLSNYTGSYRAYPFTYSLPNANTWTKIVIIIPGDTAGTWVLQGNAAGAAVYFDLGSGANYRGPAGAWASANYLGATGAVSVVGTNGATINVTGVKLEIGSVATPFNRQSLAKSLADCQRYYQQFGMQAVTFGQSAGAFNTPFYFQPMRASPTAIVGGSLTFSNCTGCSYVAYGTQSAILQNTQSAAGMASTLIPAMILNAEL